MQTIHKNKIRHIVVELVKGCEVQVFTQNPDKSKGKKHPRLISFGGFDNNKDASIKHYLSQDKKTLNIDTFRDENGGVPHPYPYRFKIVLPEGCHLEFKYSPHPCGWGS